MVGAPTHPTLTTSAFDGYVPSQLDGTPLYYEGTVGDAPTLVLLDGVGCDGYIWTALRARLGSRSFLHPHYRGHGRSRMPAQWQAVSLADLAADAWSSVRARVQQPVFLMGHSMGVQVALEMLALQPHSVAGLILVNGVAANPLRTFRNGAIESALPLIQSIVERGHGVFNWLTRRLVPTSLMYEVATQLEIPRNLVSEAAFMPYLRGMAQLDTRLFVALLSAMARHDRTPLLAQIRVPTLVIAGTDDGFTPAAASRAMADEIPRSEFLLVELGTHTTPIEHPDLVAQAIVRFLGMAGCPGAAAQ